MSDEDNKHVFTGDEYFMLAYNTPIMKEGTGLTPPEDESELKDREVNIILSRDDDGCKDAYENCGDVFNAVERKVSLYNSGIIVKSVDKSVDNNKYQKQIEHLRKRRDELELDSFLDFMLTNRELYNIGALTKKIVGNKLEYLVGIRTMISSRVQYEFTPIINSITGRLGIKGLDPEDEKRTIVAIQEAVPIDYDNEANETPGQTKYTRFDAETIMMINYGNTDMYGKGISPVRRSLRYAEGLMRLENTVLLLARRPTQLIYTAGNENHNMVNCEIPESYLEAEPDMVQAKINYKTSRLAALNKQAKNLTAGNVLAQTLEYGTSVAAIEIPEGLPYVDYMKYFSDKIKMCILPVDIPMRRVVRSAEQETKTVSELVEKAVSEQRKIKASINKNITSILLAEIGGADISQVWYDFDSIQKETKEDKARYWYYIARAADSFAKNGIQFPEEFEELSGELGIKSISKPIQNPNIENNVE